MLEAKERRLRNTKCQRKREGNWNEGQREVSVGQVDKPGSEFLRKASETLNHFNAEIVVGVTKKSLGGKTLLAQINHPLLSTLKIMLTYENPKDHRRNQKDCSGGLRAFERGTAVLTSSRVVTGWGLVYKALEELITSQIFV